MKVRKERKYIVESNESGGWQWVGTFRTRMAAERMVLALNRVCGGYWFRYMEA